MNKTSKGKFISALEKAKTEEEVKFAYVKEFEIQFSASQRHDLYTPQVFFEFKYDKNLDNVKTRSEIVAQALYYIHRLKYGNTDLPIPAMLCIADKNGAGFTDTELWKDIYTDPEGKYDWDMAPSPSNTKVRAAMHDENLGEVSRELFSQFIFRINKEFAGKQAHLCMYSKIKYLNANNDQLLRDNIFNYKFEKGFIFSAAHFHGTKGKFPVCFLVWNLKKEMALAKQNIELDIFEEAGLKAGTKIIPNNTRDNFLSKWIKRPQGTKKFPPFKSGITVAIKTNKDVRDRQ